MTCTGFSYDGKYVATGDMSGGVRVWKVAERQPVCVFESSDIEVHPNSIGALVSPVFLFTPFSLISLVSYLSQRRREL